MLTRLWRTAAFSVASVTLSWSQAAVPASPVQGDLLDWMGKTDRGELVFRNADSQVFQCSFDDKTYFERGSRQVTLSSGDKGARVEVLAEFPQPPACYARSVRFTSSRVNRTITTGFKGPDRSGIALDLITARGDLTLAGVVVKVSAGALLLRTRSNERKLILLRPDTRFLGEGQGQDCGSLAVNTPVFIRAGKNLEDEVEAYQIIWGEILEPVIEPTTY